jgi:L-alanine-DL-glutamate epimerase-like enolase superfamily enzyme
MVRSLHEARDLLLRGGIDVVQPDAVLAGGLGGCRRIAALADLVGRSFSPHTWSTGMGLVANLHLACAVSTCDFIEVPYDPPAWSSERRDWALLQPLSIDADGKIRPPAGAGLGARPDLDAIDRYRLA